MKSNKIRYDEKTSSWWMGDMKLDYADLFDEATEMLELAGVDFFELYNEAHEEVGE